jgi:hypothetical protein
MEKTMNLKRTTNKWFLVTMMILVLIVNAGCQLTPCNSELLEKVLSVVPLQSREDSLKEWSEVLFVVADGAKESTLSWDIQQRNDYGCIVVLNGDVNGVSTEGYIWFVDLEENKVYADNQSAKAVVKGWASASGDLDLLNGIPLP